MAQPIYKIQGIIEPRRLFRPIMIAEPDTWPSLSFLERLLMVNEGSGILVVQDKAQFERGTTRHVASIRERDEKFNLIVPVAKIKKRRELGRTTIYNPSIQNIAVEISNGESSQTSVSVSADSELNWQGEHYETIRRAYVRAPFLDRLIHDIEETYHLNTVVVDLKEEIERHRKELARAYEQTLRLYIQEREILRYLLGEANRLGFDFQIDKPDSYLKSAPLLDTLAVKLEGLSDVLSTPDKHMYLIDSIRRYFELKTAESSITKRLQSKRDNVKDIQIAYLPALDKSALDDALAEVDNIACSVPLYREQVIPVVKAYYGDKSELDTTRSLIAEISSRIRDVFPFFDGSDNIDKYTSRLEILCEALDFTTYARREDDPDFVRNPVSHFRYIIDRLKSISPSVKKNKDSIERYRKELPHVGITTNEDWESYVAEQPLTALIPLTEDKINLRLVRTCLQFLRRRKDCVYVEKEPGKVEKITMNSKPKKLVEFNMETLQCIMRWLNIDKVTVMYQSELENNLGVAERAERGKQLRDLDTNTRKNTELALLCKQAARERWRTTEGITYIFPEGGYAFFDEKTFKRKGIGVFLQRYRWPDYSQPGHKSRFTNLCGLDLLLNHGATSRDIILANGRIEINTHRISTPKGKLTAAHYEVDRYAPTIILAHDIFQGKNSEFMRFLTSYLIDKGYNVLGFDFQGHNESDGHDITLTDMKNNLESIINLAQNTAAKGSKLAIIGHGIGATLALHYLKTQVNLSKRERKKLISIIAMAPAMKLDEYVKQFYSTLPIDKRHPEISFNQEDIDKFTLNGKEYSAINRLFKVFYTPTDPYVFMGHVKHFLWETGYRSKTPEPIPRLDHNFFNQDPRIRENFMGHRVMPFLRYSLK